MSRLMTAEPSVQVISDIAVTMSHIRQNERRGVVSVVVVGPDKDPQKIFDMIDQHYESLFPCDHPNRLFIYRYPDTGTLLGTITSIYRKAQEVATNGIDELTKHGFFTRGAV